MSFDFPAKIMWDRESVPLSWLPRAVWWQLVSNVTLPCLPPLASPSLVSELTDATPFSRPSAGRRDHRNEKDPTLEDTTVSSAATELYLWDLGNIYLHFLINSSRLNSVNLLLSSPRHLKDFLCRSSKDNFQFWFLCNIWHYASRF